MKVSSKNHQGLVLWATICAILLGSLAHAATGSMHPITAGAKAKVTGTIQARNGDLIKVKEKKSGDLIVINLTDNTKIIRKHGKAEFYRHTDMDVTAMVPGLTVEAEGVGNAKGQLEASKITFTPDEFAVEVAEEQQIMANKAAAKNAQSTANQGVAAAGQAQNSANQAQASANQAGTTAQAAGEVAVMDADAVAMVNQRVSDLNDYKTAAEAGIYFDTDKSALDDAAKADLSKLADIAITLDGYMIEIAGYASSTGSKQLNQKLSEARAAAVTQYLREKKNIPMRRILAPAGYGATHPDATNTDPMGRALNRRVDVKVIVNKGLNEGM